VKEGWGMADFRLSRLARRRLYLNAA